MASVLYFQWVTAISASFRVSNRKVQIGLLAGIFFLCAAGAFIGNFPRKASSKCRRNLLYGLRKCLESWGEHFRRSEPWGRGYKGLVRLVGGPENTAGSAEENVPVKIEIYGQAYNVQADENEAYLKELAAYVDAKMRTVAEATRTVDSVRVAVLAALNIADELHTIRRRQDAIDGPLQKRVEKCVAMVEKALEQSA
jgi:cell division protein ZapA